MRILVKKDPSIPKKEYNMVLNEFREMYQKLSPEIDTKEHDFTDVPFKVYYSDYKGVDKAYIKEELSKLEKYSYDHVVFLVDAENWEPENVWGWNLSYAIKGFESQQVRFDTVSDSRETRVANTVGTFHHETLHALDQLAYRVNGEKLAKIAGVNDWDNEVVHGESESYDYTRHRDNLDILNRVAPTMKRVYHQREAQYRVYLFNRGYSTAKKEGAPPSILSRLLQEFRRFLSGLYVDKNACRN